MEKSTVQYFFTTTPFCVSMSGSPLYITRDGMHIVVGILHGKFKNETLACELNK